MKSHIEYDLANAVSADAVLETTLVKKTPWFSYGILAALAIIWGSSFILMKKALVHLTWQEVGAMRIFSAFVFLLPVMFTRYKLPQRKHWPYILLSGLMGSFVPAFLFAIAGLHLSSAISGSLNALSPLFTLVVGAMFFNIKTRPIAIVGVILGLFGALALSLNNPGDLSINAYAYLVVFATLCYAVNLNLLKAKLSALDSVTISSLSLALVGSISGLYLAFGSSILQKMAHPAEGFMFAMLCVILLGVFGTAIGLILFNRLLKVSSPVVAASVTYIMPAVSVFWGVLDDERIQSYHYAGLALIFAGVLLVNKK